MVTPETSPHVMENGYHKKILLVDLSRGKVEVKELENGVLRAHVGGASLAAALTWRLLDKWQVDPLSPANVLTFMAGPLTGTLAPSSGRHAVTALSPLTGGWGESTSGGFFGCKLRRAGYDGIVVRGASERPVYLYIKDGEAEIRD
ncbi:MAG: aldehyde ferredoxin oxidoreductase N-terminal domain-containing protein, partial [Candidatus Korarchaeota archaeon]|nr:aldehyde ferredoxin oxidoreductase N-terminal domain-containing protein [Candidatus Korarchaeota archaeon]